MLRDADRFLAIGDRARVALDRIEQIRGLAEGVEHGLAIGRIGSLGLIDRGALLGLQRAAVEDRCGEAGEDIEAAERAGEDIPDRRRALRQRAAERDIGIEIGRRDAHRGGGGVKIGLGLENVRPLVDQRRGQGDGNLLRQREGGEIEIGRPEIGRRDADQRGEQVPRLIELLFELRDVAAIGHELALRVEHFGERAFARVLALLRQIDVALIVGEERIGGIDSRADRGDRQHLIHHLAGEGEVRGLRLALLRLGLGGGLFDTAALLAEQIEIVTDAAADRIEIEHRIAGETGQRARLEAEAGEIGFLMLGAGIGIDLRQLAAARGGDLFARGGERGVAGLQAGVVGDRLIDQRIERGRIERCPPAQRGALAGKRGRPRRGLGQRIVRRAIGRSARRGRTLEIRADGAAGERGRGGKAGQERAKLGEGGHGLGQSICMVMGSSLAFLRGGRMNRISGEMTRMVMNSA